MRLTTSYEHNVDTLVGQQAVKDINPRTLTELASSSSLMRLMSDGELPLEKFARFKLAEELWYDELRSYQLNEKEIKVLEKYLKKKHGVGESQEVIMQIVMDPEISGFDMKEANRLRKTIAKKAFREIDAVKELFYQRGKEHGTRKELLDYVWNVQVNYQLGYSFSEIHTTAYALIALQEMNLAYHYPIIYWNCACLSVDSSAINSSDFYNLIDENIIDNEEVEGKKVQNKMDYAKLAAALDKFRNICNIQMPDINKSRLSFTPDVANNTILYGLKGISRITEPVIEEIMNNRPFSSLEDFLNRTSSRIITKDKVINLIKCGAFDTIENRSRKEILTDYIWLKAEPKKRLTMQNANMLIDVDLLPNELEYESEVYKLTKEMRKNRDTERLWYCVDRLDIPVNKIDKWREIFKNSNIAGQELIIDGETRKAVNSDSWDRYYESQMNNIRTYIKSHHDELLNKLNNRLFNDEWNKYCKGDELKWELDSLNFYFSGHPLAKVQTQLGIEIDNINNVIEGASDGFFLIKGKQIPKMHLYTLVGTVIDRDKVKGLVTLQTPDGVVNVKCYKDLYAIYAQQISVLDDQGNKEVQEESFFEKGVHLLVTGIQRGATFVPKVYKNVGRKAIMRIKLNEEGNFLTLEEKIGGIEK